MNAREYSDRLSDLLCSERHAMADFLVALADFDECRLWLDLGYASLFAFLQRQLRLSDGAAFYRQAAAHLIQKFPGAIEPLRDGRLCLTTVFELSKVLTADNAASVLPRFFGISKRQAKEIVAELVPQPAPDRTVFTVPRALPLAEADCVHGSLGQPSTPVPTSTLLPQEVRSPSSARSSATIVEPKNATETRFHTTVSRAFPKKLAAARDALSHSHPGASDAAILEVGLDLILARHAKRRGIGAKPRGTTSKKATAAPARPTRRSRHVPADVWRAVWARDRGCCAWPLDNGGVCGSTWQLELDHVKGWALGAGTTVDECRLLCRRHQDVSARRLYGDDLMNDYTRPKGGKCSEPVAEYGAPFRPPRLISGLAPRHS